MTRYLVALCAAQVVSAALAQNTPTTSPAVAAPAGQDGPEPTYRVSAGTAYQFPTSTDDSGKFSLQRTGLGMDLHYAIPDSRFTLDHALSAERDNYHFTDTPGGIAPWSNTTLASYSLRVGYKINSEWSVFTGPVVRADAEDGAAWDRALSYGGMAGVNWKASRKLTLGLGVVGVQEIEDNFSLFPLLLVNWQITPDLRLGNTRPQPGIRGGAGIELGWTFIPKWELAGGFGYEKRRFRLNGDAHSMVNENGSTVVDSSSGVGQNESYPTYLRLSYRPDNQWSISAMGGVIVGGKLRLEDSNGNELAEQDYNPALFIGAAVSWRL